MQTLRPPVAVGIVGAAEHGADLVRAFQGLPQTSLRWLCDEATLRPWSRSAFGAAWTKSIDDLLDDEELDVIAFAGPQAARRNAREALLADKHVFVAGPLAQSSAEADELADLASERSRRLWAHLPSVEHPAARRLHALVARQRLGELFYVRAQRFVSREDATPDLLWGPGADVVALVLDLVADQPIEVVARAEAYLEPPRADVVFAELRFATGVAAHIHLSRLEGEVANRLSVAAAAGAAIVDPGAPGRELALHGAVGDLAGDGAPVEPGRTLAYALPADDPTRSACARFVGAIRSPGETLHGRAAAATVGVVESLALSCASGGVPGALVRSEPATRNVLAFRER